MVLQVQGTKMAEQDIFSSSSLHSDYQLALQSVSCRKAFASANGQMVGLCVQDAQG